MAMGEPMVVGANASHTPPSAVPAVLEMAIWERYMVYDPGGARSAVRDKRRSRAACVTYGVDEWGNVVALNAWANKDPVETRLERLIDDWVLWKPIWLGVETAALQAEIRQLFQMVAAQRGIHIPTVPIPIPHGMDKDYRIKSAIRPMMAAGKIFVPEHLVELRSEIQSHPTGRTNDLVDAFASGIRMLPPRNLHKSAEGRQDVGELVKYLRSTGLSLAEAREEATSYVGAYT